MALGLVLFGAWKAAALFGGLAVCAGVVIAGWTLVQLRRRDQRPSEPSGPAEPLIVVDDSGYPAVWLRVSDALLDMEAVDVANGEYRMFLPTGEICELWVAAERIQGTPTGRFDREAAISAMQRAGHLHATDDDLEGAVWRAARDRP